MNTTSIVLLAVHLIIFLLVKSRISKRKKVLEHENAELRNKIIRLESSALYYERLLSKISKK